MSLFALEDAVVQYNGVPVLSGISLRIEPGEKVALVGSSGAGKSTLLRLLYDQQKAAASLVPQEVGLVRALTVFHNIYMGRLHRHSTWYNLANLIRPLRKEIAAVRPVVERLGLEAKVFARIEELSGGQQQRTAVGRAIHKGSAVFMGDEPVSAVDEHQSRAVLDAIVEAHETVVLSMHDVELALAYADRAIGIKDGGIVLDEPTAGSSGPMSCPGQASCSLPRPGPAS